jgi:hypothetical protein
VQAKAVGVRVRGSGEGVGGTGEAVLVGVGEGGWVGAGVWVADGFEIIGTLETVGVKVTAAGEMATSWLDEQAASTKLSHRLDANRATTLTIFPISRECTRKLGNDQISKQSLIYEPGFTGKIGEISWKEILMPRRLFVLLLFLTLTLAACKSTSQTGTVTAEASDTPKATAGPMTTPKQATTLNLPEQPSVPGCTVKSYIPTPDPTSLFPQISSEDWYRGPLTATVKIIEYSDFQ